MQATKIILTEHQLDKNAVGEGARRLREETKHNFTTDASAIAWVKKQRKASFHIAVHAHGMPWACSLIKVSKPALIKFIERTGDNRKYNWRISHLPPTPLPFKTPVNDKLTATVCVHPVFVKGCNADPLLANLVAKTSEIPKGNK